MIRNFEEYTSQMSEVENKYILPRIIQILSLKIGKEKAISNRDIINNINFYNPIYYEYIKDGKSYGCKVKTSPARVRHMIHVLRVSDTIPFLVASANGYYISNDKEEIETYIKSIDDRLRSIYQIRKALRRQTKNFPNKQTNSQQRLIL
jgi:hypothetical protein